MLSIQQEREGIVIKARPELVHAVMAVEAGITKGDRVIDHEGIVHFIVTSPAGFLLEDRDVTAMAISTLERFLRNRKRMSLQ